jgi:soluble lytic murein transglycosylase-like protein
MRLLVLLTIVTIIILSILNENRGANEILFTEASCKEFYTDRELINLARPYTTEDIPVELIVGVIKVESAGYVFAQSPEPASCCGLMQLHPRTAKIELGIQNIFDVNENIRGGSKYLEMMFDRFKSEKLALAAYHQGPTSLVRNNCHPYRITESYIKKVFDETNRIRQLIAKDNL